MIAPRQEQLFCLSIEKNIWEQLRKYFGPIMWWHNFGETLLNSWQHKLLSHVVMLSFNSHWHQIIKIPILLCCCENEWERCSYHVSIHPQSNYPTPTSTGRQCSECWPWLHAEMKYLLLSLSIDSTDTLHCAPLCARHKLSIAIFGSVLWSLAEWRCQVISDLSWALSCQTYAKALI